MSTVYTVKWSDEDGEWVATGDEFPSLSWLEGEPVRALDVLRKLENRVRFDIAREGMAESVVPLGYDVKQKSNPRQEGDKYE